MVMFSFNSIRLELLTLPLILIKTIYCDIETLKLIIFDMVTRFIQFCKLTKLEKSLSLNDEGEREREARVDDLEFVPKDSHEYSKKLELPIGSISSTNFNAISLTQFK